LSPQPSTTRGAQRRAVDRLTAHGRTRPPHAGVTVTGTTEPSAGLELAGVFARVSGLLLSEQTVQASLSLLTALAAETLPGSIGAGITLTDQHGGATTSAASSPVVDQADSLQYSLAEGPCLQACERREVVRSDDIGADPRWPRWCQAVGPLGLRSVLSVPLVAGDVTRGAIKVCSDRTGAYGPTEEHRLSMFGAQAAVLVANQQTHAQASRLSDGLKETLRRRDVIAMARGLLMGREGVDEEGAFRLLVSLARGQDAPVERVAEELLRSTSRARR
jgi:GAF domain-containing protein